MKSANRQHPGMGRLLQSGGWIALPTALLANALLFSVLAGARTAPSRSHIPDAAPLHLRLTELPGPDEVGPDITLLQDRIAVGISETALASSAPLSTYTASLTPRLPHGIEALRADLPGLPVDLPGLSDLQSIPTGPAGGSAITGPFSQTEVDRIPRKIAGAPPQYPRWARRAGLEGTVTLRLVVTAQGTVTDINIHHLEGDESFGREAARAVASWRFNPAVKDGTPVPYWFFYTVNFELDE